MLGNSPVILLKKPIPNCNKIQIPKAGISAPDSPKPIFQPRRIALPIDCWRTSTTGASANPTNKMIPGIINIKPALIKIEQSKISRNIFGKRGKLALNVWFNVTL